MKPVIYEFDSCLMKKITINKDKDLDKNYVLLKQRIKIQLEFYKKCKKNLHGFFDDMPFSSLVANLKMDKGSDIFLP